MDQGLQSFLAPTGERRPLTDEDSLELGVRGADKRVVGYCRVLGILDVDGHLGYEHDGVGALSGTGDRQPGLGLRHILAVKRGVSLIIEAEKIVKQGPVNSKLRLDEPRPRETSAG